MIVRVFRGWVGTDHAIDYIEYINRVGLPEYREHGSLGAQLWTHDLSDGRTEVVFVSWWQSIEDIRGYAGDDIDQAVLYPEDRGFLIDHESSISHYLVALDDLTAGAERHGV